MADTNRERDLVLAPNEYAYISDQTKGHVITYVGPYKTSLANTDKPVVFDNEIKRFKICSLEESTQTFSSVPEGWYITLKNPTRDGSNPKTGTSNSLPELEIGRKVNISGPCFFALWPGQMARIIPGHNLRSNQYLVVRIYDDGQARKNWTKAVVKTKTDGGEAEELNEVPELSIGQLLIIKGTSVSFYIPPTGVEVVRDDDYEYIRDAVSLERLEYCILLDESGNKRYIKGPAVVFPEPNEVFIEVDGFRKFKAIELNEISGIYVKVIAPYSENDRTYTVGEELFIMGSEQMIYYPRPEHALIRYGDQEIYSAVAIPAGEGRYYLNRKTGKISLMKGPCMFLPDPRESVIVKRVLSQRQVELMFPGNAEAAAYNLSMQAVAKEQQAEDFVVEPQRAKAKKSAHQSSEGSSNVPSGFFGNDFKRSQTFDKPRTIVLDEKYSGAVTVDIWTGYAVQVVSRTGSRKVIVGPQTYLLEYDETLQPIELSTGTPKVDVQLMRSVYLRVYHNKVSDVVKAETKDFCSVRIHLSYRVNFTGESDKWFNVENYVKFLTDHMRSVIRNALQRLAIMDFYTNGISAIRDIVLGQTQEGGRRSGRLFEENGMQIYDVEVQNIVIENTEIQILLSAAQHREIKQKVDLSTQERDLAFTVHTEHTNREISLAKHETRKLNLGLEVEQSHKQLEVNLAKLETERQSEEKAAQNKLAQEQFNNQIAELGLIIRKNNENLDIEIAQKYLAQRLEEMHAEVNATVSKASAVSPELIAALQAFGDKALAEKMAASMAPLAILGGGSVAEVFANLLKGTGLEQVLKLKSME
ncbi:MAG: hypothetical protein EAZ57_05460 [Cytophagales bacterium]|nr:MAG: hypothetical protein EAZ67_06120 [Cytophagales bacterium]TAF60992.1 MAG: hypothetical protein EAZ57_05460 [Cytophagales bacterium]